MDKKLQSELKTGRIYGIKIYEKVTKGIWNTSQMGAFGSSGIFMEVLV